MQTGIELPLVSVRDTLSILCHLVMSGGEKFPSEWVVWAGLPRQTDRGVWAWVICGSSAAELGEGEGS